MLSTIAGVGLGLCVITLGAVSPAGPPLVETTRSVPEVSDLRLASAEADTPGPALLGEIMERITGAPAAPAGSDCAGAPGDPAGPGDSVALRVFETDAEATGAAPLRFERLDLSGTYDVDGDGALSLPALGRLPASGASLACIERRVVDAVANAFGTDATVSARYAARPPVLVQGDVAAPGGYDHQPGMTVRRLLASAGGGPSGMNEGERRALSARRAELETLRSGLTLHLARLTALRDGADALVLSDDELARLTDRLGGERVEGERAALVAARAAAAATRSRDAERRADLDAARALAEESLAAAETQAEETVAAIDAAEALLAGECRVRCVEGRQTVESRLETLRARAANLDLLVLDKRRALEEVIHASRAHDRATDLALADADRTIALQISEVLAERTALDAQLDGVNTRSGNVHDDDARRIVLERWTGGTAEQLAAGPDTALRPGDLVTVSADGARRD